MADASIPADWYRQGWLPPLCARHGGAATRRIKRTFYTRTPGWVLLLIFVSLLIALIVSLAIRKSAAGSLPGCDRCVSERRRYLGSVVGGWVLGLALIVLGASADNGAVVLIGLLVWLVALVWTVCGDYLRVRGNLRKDLIWVDVKGVSAAFAAELRAGVLRAQQAHFAQQSGVGAIQMAHGSGPSIARDILPGS